MRSEPIRAAALSGIDTRRRIILAFGLLLFAAATGRSRGSTPGRAGDDRARLPAAGLRGGSARRTSVRPGRVNVWER
jgi:hypothetical protein